MNMQDIVLETPLPQALTKCIICWGMASNTIAYYQDKIAISWLQCILYNSHKYLCLAVYLIVIIIIIKSLRCTVIFLHFMYLFPIIIYINL